MKDLTGMIFGRYEVIGFAEKRFGNAIFWSVRCECGERRIVRGAHLKSGAAKSRGCLRSDTSTVNATRHGHCGSKTYWIWAAMKDRCRNPNNKEYKWYGGAGVSYCDRWEEFQNFLEDMGECRPGYSIERRNPWGDYCPENCEWIPRSKQNLNKRNSRKYAEGIPNIKGWKAGVHYYDGVKA
jgi:hypothetical protein